MKNLFKILGLSLTILFGSLNLSAQVVVVKPNRPTVIVKKPGKAKKGHTWVNGHWKWQAGKYVWVKGHWKRNKSGHNWVPGHWQKVKGGHQWVPGHWKVTTPNKRKRRRRRARRK